MGTCEQPKGRHQRGAAIVEFAIVAVPMCLLLFGIIVFGLLLSFKQNLTHATNDAARAGAVVPVDQDTAPADGIPDAVQEAEEALEVAVNAYDRSCDDPADGLTCVVQLVGCDGTPAGTDCLEVRIDFDNTGATSLLPAVPLLAFAVPDTLTARSVVETFNAP